MREKQQKKKLQEVTESGEYVDNEIGGIKNGYVSVYTASIR